MAGDRLGVGSNAFCAFYALWDGRVLVMEKTSTVNTAEYRIN
jgi:hypothetical protein